MLTQNIGTTITRIVLGTERPSSGLNFLMSNDSLERFPELTDLKGCKQNPDSHPEGDVWTHTMRAIDLASKLVSFIPNEWKMAYIFGVLCHDFGKPSVTDPVTLKAYGHDEAGVPLAESFMRKLPISDDSLTDKVKLIVRHHMAVNQLFKQVATKRAWRRLNNKVRLDVLGYVAWVDSCSKPGRKTNPATYMALKMYDDFFRYTQ